MLSNTERGRLFQLRVLEALQRRLGEPFETEIHLPIGQPPKLHPFDLVSNSRKYAAECKAFTWTATGNTPSAKITTLREAVTYLRMLPPDVTRILVMKKAPHPTRGELLCDYFVRLNSHLLESVVVAELPEDGGEMRIVCGMLPRSSRDTGTRFGEWRH